MEKELIINGIKYVKYEEYKEYKIYDLVNYNGYEWIVIDVEDNKLTLMMKNCFPKEKMKAIFKEEYLTEDGGIKYNLNKTCNDWNKTEIKRGLNNEFLEEFNKDELIKMKTNYDTDKYSYDYIRIPKIREIKRLDSNRVKPNFVCWTMSPSNFSATSGHASEWVEYLAGILTNWNIYSSLGVCPVITLKSDNLNIKKISEEL